jgi:hypothetical protein
MRSTAGPDTGRVSELRPPVGPGEFEPFLTAREVAERLWVAPCTVLRYFEDGVLPGRRLRAGGGGRRPGARARSVRSARDLLHRDRRAARSTTCVTRSRRGAWRRG